MKDGTNPMWMTFIMPTCISVWTFWTPLVHVRMGIHCVRKNVNSTQCTIKMWHLNASCLNFVHLILKYSVKYAQSFIEKCCPIAELSIFKYWWWNILVSSTAYCSHFDAIIYTVNMEFSANDRVIIKVSRQEKLYGAKRLIAEFQQAVDTETNCCRRLTQTAPSKGSIAPGAWKRTVSKNEEFIDEAVKHWRLRLRACLLYTSPSPRD